MKTWSRTTFDLAMATLAAISILGVLLGFLGAWHAANDKYVPVTATTCACTNCKTSPSPVQPSPKKLAGPWDGTVTLVVFAPTWPRPVVAVKPGRVAYSLDWSDPKVRAAWTSWAFTGPTVATLVDGVETSRVTYPVAQAATSASTPAVSPCGPGGCPIQAQAPLPSP